jgi:hypothetical protein
VTESDLHEKKIEEGKVSLFSFSLDNRCVQCRILRHNSLRSVLHLNLVQL